MLGWIDRELQQVSGLIYRVLGGFLVTIVGTVAWLLSIWQAKIPASTRWWKIRDDLLCLQCLQLNLGQKRYTAIVDQRLVWEFLICLSTI